MIWIKSLPSRNIHSSEKTTNKQHEKSIYKIKCGDWQSGGGAVLFKEIYLGRVEENEGVCPEEIYGKHLKFNIFSPKYIATTIFPT